jgi:ribosomal protein S18 acetylase RimI-like enzyme
MRLRVANDHDLYTRGAATLVASWEAYAAGSEGAAIVRAPGVAAAVFPTEPERTVYNNAILERDLDPTARATAVDAMEHAYGSARIERYAAWVHESDAAMIVELSRRGYSLSETTRAMGMRLDNIPVPRPKLELASPDWHEYLLILGMPEGFLSAADRSSFQILIAQLDGANAATAMAYDCDDDCGLYNVTTLENARRRGLGTALSALHLHDARSRGCTTASLQSTPMAERLYGAVGFRDLGRILEYVKSRTASARRGRRPTS